MMSLNKLIGVTKLYFGKFLHVRSSETIITAELEIIRIRRFP